LAGLEAINMKELDDTSIEVATGNIILVMLEHFERAFERCSKLGRQGIFLSMSVVSGRFM
jgi:hypothetical protein